MTNFIHWNCCQKNSWQAGKLSGKQVIPSFFSQSHHFSNGPSSTEYSVGVVIVTTPQDIALIDARRGAEMFNKVKAPVRKFTKHSNMWMDRGRIGYGCTSPGLEIKIFRHWQQNVLRVWKHKR